MRGLLQMFGLMQDPTQPERPRGGQGGGGQRGAAGRGPAGCLRGQDPEGGGASGGGGGAGHRRRRENHEARLRVSRRPAVPVH